MSDWTSDKKLDKLIKKTLGKDKEREWVVPQEYRPIYRSHLQQFPNDTNFIVDLEDRVLTCVENECFEDVALSFDGNGLFSLANYATHILNSSRSQAHVTQRNLRVKQSTPARPAVKAEPDLDLTDDTKPEVPAVSSSYKRPLATSSGPTSPAKKHKSGDDLAGPHSGPTTEQRNELVQLDNRQIRVEAQKKRLLEQAGPGPINPTHQTQLEYFGISLNNIKNERAQLTAIIAGQAPPPIVRHTSNPIPAQTPVAASPAPAAVAGPGPRTALAATNPALAAAAARIQEEERKRREAQQDAALRAYGGWIPTPRVAGDPVEGAKPALDGTDPIFDQDYGSYVRDYDAAIDRSSKEFSDFLQKAADDMFDHTSTVEDAAQKIGLTREKPTPPSMVCRLMAHQLMGVAWMVEQENSDSYGGILGDEMGLGKTVQAIATMTLNESTDPKEKTTLVVAPLALLKQWEREIEEKTVPNHYRILIYHGQGKKDVKKVKQLLKYDVVITTYQTVVLEWPDEDGMVAKAKKEAKKRGDGANWENYVNYNKKEGFLFKANFYRIILDESQTIRNKATKVARAVAQLDSLLRWCLTGTPITNRLEDVFPMLRFLQIKPWYNWEEFKHRCVLGDSRANEAARRLQVVIRPHLFRRKKDSKIDGKPILQLPERTVELRLLEFSPEEREIYSAVENKSQIQFNKYLKAGTVLKNYAHVLVMLLRLRQVAFHPALLGAYFDEMHEEREKMEAIDRATELLGKAWVDRLKQDRLDVARERAQAERDGETDSVDSEECPICLEPATANEGGALVTKCRHIFCKPCLQEVLQADAPEDEEDAGGPRIEAHQRPCPTCRGGISSDECFVLAAFEPPPDKVEQAATKGSRLGSADEVAEEDDDDPTLGGFIVKDGESDESDFELVDRKGKGKAKPKKPKQPNRAVIQDSDDEEDEIDELDSEEDSDARSKGKGKGKGIDKGKGKGKVMLNDGPKTDKKMSAKEKKRAEDKWRADQEPSTKMMWVLSEIRRLEAEAPDDKIIISCSFVTALDMVEDHLTSEGIRVVRFQGDMTADERDTSVQVLKKSKKCKIMLMSLKSGGVGLNLVRANRWISLDLAWSFAVEEQAFARIHRIGQDKPVFVDRLTIADSVEQRIGALQEHKQKIADASLGEGSGGKIGKLSIAELAGLFGLTEGGERVEAQEA